MPRGTPRIGNAPTPDSSKELADTPTSELLGTLTNTDINKPFTKSSMWTSGDGSNIDMSEDLPPWEKNPAGVRDNTDARRFIKCPDNWVLRWVNPRIVDHLGWRDWQPVMASDTRVTVLVRELVSPEGNIRRGRGGDLLAWMYKSWVDSRSRLKAEKVQRLTASATERVERVRDEMRRGGFGRYIHVDSAKHPTHTMGEGRTMTDG